MTEYERWKEAWNNAAIKFTPVLIESNAGSVLVESNAGTGSRCVVVVTDLPEAARQTVGGGSKLVSVMYPWTAVYPVNGNADSLTVDYLSEKFSGDVQSGRRHGGDMAQVALAVKLAVFEFDRREVAV